MNPHRCARLPEAELEGVLLEVVQQKGFLREVRGRRAKGNVARAGGHPVAS